MPSVNQEFGGEKTKQPLLRAVDLKAAGKVAFAAVVWSVRRAPASFSAPLIVEFDTDVMPGINAMALNITETRKLAAMGPGDDYAKWKGWGVVFRIEEKVFRRTGEKAWGFVVVKALRADEVAKSRTSKPLTDKELAARAQGPLDSEVPF